MYMIFTSKRVFTEKYYSPQKNYKTCTSLRIRSIHQGIDDGEISDNVNEIQSFQKEKAQ